MLATGTSLSYQWQEKVLVPPGAYGNIPGATAPDLVLSNVDATAAGKTYRCEVSSPCGEILYSDDVALTLLDEINITTQPASDTVCEGSAVNFQVISDGSNPSYQWQFDAGGVFNDLGGSTNSNLTILNALLADEGDYRCIVTNLCGTENSSIATLIVDEAVIITDEPDNVDACVNEDISFVVTATGTNRTYKWQYDDLSGGGYVNLNNAPHPSGSGSLVSGVSNAIVQITGVAADDEGNYQCLVTNGCGIVTSSTAILSIHDPTILNAAFPTDKSKCIGDDANFTVNITSGTVTSYKWQFDDDSGYTPLVDGLQASGSDIPIGSSASNTLSVNNLFAADEGLYRCEVIGICGTVFSNAATLNIDEPVSITSNPTDKMACETEDVTFTVTATGTGLSHQWWEDNGAGADAMLGGAVNPNLVLTNVDAGHEDDYYCVVTNSCNSQTSAFANLTLLGCLHINNYICL